MRLTGFTSRRALLAVLAAASPIIIGAAAPALAEGDDAELLALEVEKSARFCGLGDDTNRRETLSRRG